MFLVLRSMFVIYIYICNSVLYISVDTFLMFHKKAKWINLKDDIVIYEYYFYVIETINLLFLLY